MKKSTTKDYILEKLELNKGRYITGMELANELGISRNAIWKVISDLKSEGYQISSVNNKGYCLSEDSDIISIAGIRNALGGEYKRIADNIAIYDELESTNRTAKLELVTGMIDKKIIIARKQTSGRGHNNSHFKSPEGGIYISIILQPEDLIQGRKGNIISTNKIGETVLAVIKDITNKNAVLDKKLNRITIGKKQVCGILTEYFADMETSTINGYVIGIGIKNINISKNLCIAKLLTAFASYINID